MKVQKYIDILKYWKDRVSRGEPIASDVEIRKFTDDITQIEDKLQRLQVCANMLEGMARNMRYVDYVYEIIVRECGELDSIYGDFIERLVGTRGLEVLIENELLETCGVVNGRQLYVLRNKK